MWVGGTRWGWWGMSGQATERAFEAAVESMLLGGGWVRADGSGWDVGLALFPARVVDFVRAAQPELWEQTAAYAGDGMEALLVERLGRNLIPRGRSRCSVGGSGSMGKTFRVASFRPANDLNREMVELFERNELSVTRQVRCHPGKRQTVDMVFALNGIRWRHVSSKTDDWHDLAGRGQTVQAGPHPGCSVVSVLEAGSGSLRPRILTRYI